MTDIELEQFITEYGGDINKQKDLARKYNVSQSYVSRILCKGFDLCKQYLIDQGYFNKEDFNGRKNRYNKE